MFPSNAKPAFKPKADPRVKIAVPKGLYTGRMSQALVHVYTTPGANERDTFAPKSERAAHLEAAAKAKLEAITLIDNRNSELAAECAARGISYVLRYQLPAFAAFRERAPHVRVPTAADVAQQIAQRDGQIIRDVAAFCSAMRRAITRTRRTDADACPPGFLTCVDPRRGSCFDELFVLPHPAVLPLKHRLLVSGDSKLDADADADAVLATAKQMVDRHLALRTALHRLGIHRSVIDSLGSSPQALAPPPPLPPTTAGERAAWQWVRPVLRVAAEFVLHGTQGGMPATAWTTAQWCSTVTNWLDAVTGTLVPDCVGAAIVPPGSQEFRRLEGDDRLPDPIVPDYLSAAADKPVATVTIQLPDAPADFRLEPAVRWRQVIEAAARRKPALELEVHDDHPDRASGWCLIEQFVTVGHVSPVAWGCDAQFGKVASADVLVEAVAHEWATRARRRTELTAAFVDAGHRALLQRLDKRESTRMVHHRWADLRDYEFQLALAVADAEYRRSCVVDATGHDSDCSTFVAQQFIQWGPGSVDPVFEGFVDSVLDVVYWCALRRQIDAAASDALTAVPDD